MSYILDALKKVEQEREFEHVPGLHSRHDEPLRRPARRWPWVLAAGLVVNAVLIGALWWHGTIGPGEETHAARRSTESVAEDASRRVVVPPPAAPPTQSEPRADVAEPVPSPAQPEPPAQTVTAPLADPGRVDASTVASVPPPSVISQRPLRPLPLVEPLPAPQPAPARTDKPRQAEKPAAPDPSASAALANPSEIVELRAPSVPPRPKEEPAWKRLPLWPLVPGPIARQVNGRLVLNAHYYSEDPDERFVLLNMKKYVAGERTAEGPDLEAITREGVILTVPEGRFRLKSQ